MAKTVELLPVTYDPDKLQMWADENFRRIVDAVNTLGSPVSGGSGLSVPAGNVVAGSFGANVGAGSYSFPNDVTIGNALNVGWIELRNTGGNSTIDFTRTPGTADFNVRLSNEVDNQLSAYTPTAADSNTGGRFHVGNAWIGSHPVHGVNGWAAFGHISQQTSQNYGFLQNNAGTSIVNSAPGQIISLNIAGSQVVGVGVDNMGMNQAFNLNGKKLWTKAYNDDTHRIQHFGSGDFLMINSYDSVRIYLQSGVHRASFESGGNLWIGYVFRGGWGSGGGGLMCRNGGNVFSANWDGVVRLEIDNAGSQKNFIIDHPLDSKKHLIHACIEGPENAVFYRGQGQLENGWAQIDLPEYFEALCAQEGRSVQLTCIADSPEDEWCPVLHATYPKNGKFFVGLGSGMAINNQRFWWEVKAVRKDVSPVKVQPFKKDITVMGSGPYTYYKEK